MKYETYAESAVKAQLSPATPDETRQHWRALGVTRQTEYRWRTLPATVPLMARLAAAWLAKDGAE